MRLHSNCSSFSDTDNPNKMLSIIPIPKSKISSLLNSASDIPTDIILEVHDDEDKVSVFHAHKMHLARISKVLRRRFFGGFEETSDVVDIRGTIAQAFETMINFVYQRECGLERKTFEELFEIANLAEKCSMT